MIKLKRLSEPEWFNFPGFKDVRLLIKPIGFKERISSLDKAKRKFKVDGELVDGFSEGAFAYDAFNSSLVDFEGIEADGNLSKQEMKDMLFEVDSVREFVGEKATELAETRKQDFEKQRKNSKSSQSG